MGDRCRWGSCEYLGDKGKVDGPPNIYHYNGQHSINTDIHNSFNAALKFILDDTKIKTELFPRLISQRTN